jgi:DHA1 family inner membrane transport protein
MIATVWLHIMRTRLVLVTLFVGAFTMGCAEMLPVGLLDLIAEDLRVGVPAAGMLVTANALGLALGGPLLTLVTTRLERRRVLLVALAVFAAGSLLPALGAGFVPLLLARVVLGAVQGVFIAAGISTATAVVPAARAGRSMAVVISGFATASAVGLPLGTLLGHAMGWRAAFIVLVAQAIVVLGLALAVLPRVPSSPDARLGAQARYAFAPRVLGMLALCLVIFCGIQSALTYLVPFLGAVTSVSGPGIGVYLLAYGVATTVGSAAGGALADVNASRTLVLGTAGVALSLGAIMLGGANPLVVLVATFGVGLFGMGMAPSMQHRVAALAGPGAPLAASLPASAVNAGIALGSLAGGAAYAAGGPSASILAATAIAVVSILAAAAASLLHPVRQGALA